MATAIMDIIPNDPSLGQNGDLGLRPTASQASPTSRITDFTEHNQAQRAIMPEPPPDGGVRAWSQVVAGHLINSLTWYVFFFSFNVTSWVLGSHRSNQLLRRNRLHRTMLKSSPIQSVNFAQGDSQHRLAYINCIIRKHYFYRLRRSLG